ncbi:MAG: O-antigen ligase family protein, partial [candidate division KSB1 bacterium]|nr:O-antigen ligase family protein [candidate division KSB1 bacterium]
LWHMARIKSWHKLWVLLFILIAAGLHLITGSRSSILAGMLAVVTWFFVTKQKMKPIVLSVLVAGIVMLLIETTPIEQSFERTVNRDKSITTLTGRSDFWIESLELIMERPLMGYGFGTAGKILAESELYNPDLRLWSGSAKTSLHNGYLTVASGVGVFGALIWIALLMMPLWQMQKLNPLPARAVIMAILLSCLLLNFVEDAINAGTSVPALIFWMAWTAAIRMEHLETNQTASPGGRIERLGKQKEQIPSIVADQI